MRIGIERYRANHAAIRVYRETENGTSVYEPCQERIRGRLRSIPSLRVLPHFDL